MEKEFQLLTGNFAEFLTECFSHHQGTLMMTEAFNRNVSKVFDFSWHQRTLFFPFMQEPTDHFEVGNSLHEDGTVTTERHT